MDKWIVPIVVALIAASATLVAAYVAAAKDRRDSRLSIARDLELIDKLPKDSDARQLLTSYVEERCRLLPAEGQVRQASWEQLHHDLIPVVVIAAVVASKYFNGWVFVAGAVGMYVSLLWSGKIRRSAQQRVIDTRITELRSTSTGTAADC